jgi:maltose alpha-D-glucosyltransferase / alpha-amylase
MMDISVAAPAPTLVAVSENALWYKDAIIYQLHVKSFFDANNDGIGDLPGLIAKLDYIADLGVNTIWLLPFYPSPRRDDGYDISRYRGVHPDYGTIADVRRFIAAAHARGMRVITELVVNHTSDQHPWFQRARQAKPGSMYRDFYVWSNDDHKYAGTRVIFVDTQRSNWTWDEVAGAYYWHRFYPHQPDLNFDNPRVLKEILAVLRYWLDLGVDGLRLDAVPYLVEREGTNNENLPETHAVLKQIRAELDAHYPDRMLLAEANQWPEDAKDYFGDDDECHMAFHFPLMPRMYMAIAREDRFPITDILRQTPDIPPNSQWAIFLRNHDELTLEMVTSSERDFLWETYAADRRARLNLGIRRRLTPLLEHDRRRVELMNYLLFSMPGTPVIYYGDEIGMGDNIHLGDRDGVRTPMQWSPDRNGGFSRANPAALVLPPIMDALYGFEAVNVEAQAADPHSLLNWTRRMLAVRKRHRAFGRGGLRFLYPGNRKVLAFLRELSDGVDEEILCVANLSRSAQAVELDLPALAGRTPVELVGGSVFPPIGQPRYLLTLPPYGFYWFLLADKAQLPSWHTPSPQVLPELTTLVVRRMLEDVLDGANRGVTEREILPAYLPNRRWFGAKGEALQSARFAYGVRMRASADPLLLTEVEVVVGGRTERYVLPIAGVAEESASSLVSQLAIARLRRGREVGYLTDGFAVDGLPHACLTAYREHLVLKLPDDRGELRFLPSERLADVAPGDNQDIRRLSAEQSNSSLIIGEQLVIKIIRKVAAGVHPEAEMTGFLTRHSFPNVAPLFGELVRVDADGTRTTLGLLQGFVRNQGDGWGWTLDFLHRVVDEIAVTGQDDETADEDEAFAPYMSFAAAVGRRLAEMHALLAQPTDETDFQPEPADTDTRRRWADGAIEQIDAAFRLLRQMREWPDPDAQARAQTLLARDAELHELCRRLSGAAGTALSTRMHGDFHLGQVLVVQGDAYIIDFEGEPARPIEQRRAKGSPLRDVAGLLRSFDYAAATAAPGRAAASPHAEERRAALLPRFREHAQAAFLDSYRAVLHAAPRPWVAPEAEAALLDLFVIEKAAYEIRYEASNRPTWIGIPLRGLGEIAQRLLPAQEA